MKPTTDGSVVVGRCGRRRSPRRRTTPPLAAATAIALSFVVGAPALLPESAVRHAIAAAPSDYALLDGARRGHLIRRGERGRRVAALQRALNAVGFGLAVDGDFGPITARAVMLLQRASNLGIDGVVGPLTMRALDRALGVTVPPRPAPRPTPTPTPTPTPPTPTPTPTPPPATSATIPRRPAGAIGGSAFIAATSSLSRAARETEIQRQLLSGNVPGFLRGFRSVTTTARGADGRARQVTIRVAPDYLAIGSDADFVRMPMGGPTAQAAADRFGCILPTRRIVDLVWRSASLRLRPIPMTPGALMMSNGYYSRHNTRIEQQRAGRPLGELTAGHKKDVVVTDRLIARPGRVAIYGWHQPNGSPIQPLSTVHIASYADYSHGVRLIDRRCFVDGVAMDVADVLGDPILHPLLSDEGRITRPRY